MIMLDIDRGTPIIYEHGHGLGIAAILNEDYLVIEMERLS
jgi:hypothetical protein